MSNQVRTRSLVILIVSMVVVVAVGYAVVTSGLLALIFDPDTESLGVWASLGTVMAGAESGGGEGAAAHTFVGEGQLAA